MHEAVWRSISATFPKVTSIHNINGNKGDNRIENVGAADICLENVRVFDGVALWTENFTPSTANDYD